MKANVPETFCRPALQIKLTSKLALSFLSSLKFISCFYSGDMNMTLQGKAFAVFVRGKEKPD